MIVNDPSLFRPFNIGAFNVVVQRPKEAPDGEHIFKKSHSALFMQELGSKSSFLTMYIPVQLQ